MAETQLLHAFLRRYQRVGLDTNIFIYELEDYPAYQFLARYVFQWLASPGHSAVTSTLTMTEVLTLPYAERSRSWVDQYYKFLVLYPNIEWIPPMLEIADLAAQYRGRYKLRTPDAIQAATAVNSGVRGFISNDPVFKRIEALDVLVFEELQ